jgi:hypothetical protein
MADSIPAHIPAILEPLYIQLGRFHYWMDKHRLESVSEVDTYLAAHHRTSMQRLKDLDRVSDLLELDWKTRKTRNSKKIRAKNRTCPMTLRRAAYLMGYGKSRDASERLRAAINSGAVACEHLTRQSHVFDRNDFPKENWKEVTPTHPKSP